MEHRSSPSELLESILKSTLFLVDHYRKHIDHHQDADSELNHLRVSLKRTIAALENAAEEPSPNHLDRFPTDHINGI